MIEPTQQAWKEYANRLRAHWVLAASSCPDWHAWYEAGRNEDDYRKAHQKWYDDHYLTEPMYPGQEYANNH